MRKIVRGDTAPVLVVVGDVQVHQGGLGSGLAPVPGSTSDFYLLTDRGPNVEGSNANMKLFPMPGYSPRIYKVHLTEDTLRVTGEIVLKRADGTLLTGIPIPAGSCGSTLVLVMAPMLEQSRGFGRDIPIRRIAQRTPALHLNAQLIDQASEVGLVSRR